MKVNGIKIYKVSPDVITYYKQNVKGNKDLNDHEITLKITRNILIAHKVNKNILTGKATYIYGNLLIRCKWNKVIEVNNSPENSISTWKLSKKKYIELNKMLGIKDCKFTRSIKSKKVV